MSQTYRIGSLSFTGSQAILSASLDVSGSGRFTDGLTVTGSFTVITGSSREFQVRNTGVDIGNIITDIHTVTGSLNISGSITGSLFGTASFALATATAPASDRIVTSNITASVSTATGSIFSVVSGSSTLFSINSSGALLLSGSSSSNSITITPGAANRIQSVGGIELLATSTLRIRTTNDVVILGTSNLDRWYVESAGHLTTATDNVHDIGLSGSRRPRNIYAAGTGSRFAALDITFGSTNALRTFPSTGNTFLGSTPVDGGFKLDVNGTIRSQGALTVANTINITGPFSHVTTASVQTQANSIVTQFDSNGGTGGYSGGYDFRLGSNLGPTTSSFRIWKGGAGNLSRIGIGDGLTESQIQNATNTHVLINSNISGSTRNAAIRISGYNTTTEYNGIQFDFSNLDSLGGTFVGTQYNPATNGYDSDLVILATSASADSYNEIARFVGKSRSVSIGSSPSRNPIATLDVSGSGRFTGGLTVTGSVNISSVINLSLSNSLPTGTTGSLAASGSSLYFHDGSNWRQVSLL